MGHFKNTQFDYKTIEPDQGGFDVYGHGTYEEHSVLAGRPKRCFLDHFNTIEEAKEKYPEAEELDGSSKIPGYNSGDLMSREPEAWFDPMAAGEAWGEDDY